MENASKRARNANWSEEEKKLLRQLVLDRIEVIENKDTSTNTNSRKKAAWSEVLACFNTLNTQKRDLGQLLNQWRNSKNSSKKRIASYKKAQRATGGGPPPPSPSPEDVELLLAIPNEFAVDSNKFDSDGAAEIQAVVDEPQSEPQDLQIFLGSTSATIALETSAISDEKWAHEKPVGGIEVQETSANLHDNRTHQKPVGGTKDMKRKQDVQQKGNSIKMAIKRKVNKHDYEAELFQLVKKEKLHKIEYAAREHEMKIKEREMKMKIHEMELQYWAKKANE